MCSHDREDRVAHIYSYIGPGEEGKSAFLPARIASAALNGHGDIVMAWLEAGGGVNDVGGDRFGRTLLVCATYGPGRNREIGHLDETHVALARYLLDRGADVNLPDYNNCQPLHYAALGRAVSAPAMVALLLKAGANVLTQNTKRHNALTTVLRQLAKAGPSSSRLKIALLLLRATPSLDCARTHPSDPDLFCSAEVLLDVALGRVDTPPPPVVHCFQVLRGVIRGVRAAGGWKAYDRKPREELLRLRSLALRRRAFLRRSRHDDTDIRSIRFIIRCPPEIAWHILGYWRCQYFYPSPGINAQLGFR